MTAQGNSPTGRARARPRARATGRWPDSDGAGSTRTAPSDEGATMPTANARWASTRRHARRGAGVLHVRFDGAAFEVQVAEQGQSRGLRPDEATSIKQVAASSFGPTRSATSSGSARLDALGPRSACSVDSAAPTGTRKLEEAHAREQEIVAEAENLRRAKDWRNGVNRLARTSSRSGRHPRLDASVTTSCGTGLERAHVVHPHRRDPLRRAGENARAARVVSNACSEAEASTSTESDPTSSRFRTLMPTGRPRRRAARSRKTSAESRAARGHLLRPATPRTPSRTTRVRGRREKKDLVEAELLSRPRGGRARLPRHRRPVDAAGKVPRDQMKTLEGRIRRSSRRPLDQGRQVARSDRQPARADDMLGELRARHISDIETNLEKARAAGQRPQGQELERASPFDGSSSSIRRGKPGHTSASLRSRLSRPGSSGSAARPSRTTKLALWVGPTNPKCPVGRDYQRP